MMTNCYVSYMDGNRKMLSLPSNFNRSNWMSFTPWITLISQTVQIGLQNSTGLLISLIHQPIELQIWYFQLDMKAKTLIFSGM